MSIKKKDGLFKRLFGGSKGCCCDVQINEIEETPGKTETDSDSKTKCCSSDEEVKRVLTRRDRTGGYGCCFCRCQTVEAIH